MYKRSPLEFRRQRSPSRKTKSHGGRASARGVPGSGPWRVQLECGVMLLAARSQGWTRVVAEPLARQEIRRVSATRDAHDAAVRVLSEKVEPARDEVMHVTVGA